MNNTFNNNFGAGVSGIQLQQVTIGSIQVQGSDVVTGFDFDKCAKVIAEIKKYENTFNCEFGNNADAVKDSLNCACKGISKKDAGLVRKGLIELKNFAESVSASIVASGILNLVNGLPFLGV